MDETGEPIAAPINLNIIITTEDEIGGIQVHIQYSTNILVVFFRW